MDFITIAILASETFMITPRYTGQIVRLAGQSVVTTAGMPVRIYGTGVVELSSGWWDDMLIVAGEYDDGYFDGSATPADPDLERFSWEGLPNRSASIRETRFPVQVPWDDDRYQAIVDRYRRVLYDVRTISGPLVQQELSSSDKTHVGRIVEFTLVAEEPHVYGLARQIPSGATTGQVVQDIPYNLAPYPSAEIALGTVTVATNYVTNPSLEVNDSGWSGVGLNVNPSLVTTGRTSELAAAGAWSYRTRLLGNTSVTTPSGAPATVRDSTFVLLSTLPDGSRPSFRIWGAAIAISGDQPSALRAYVEWSDGSTSIGQTPLVAEPGGGLNGQVFSAKSLVPPAGTYSASIVVEADVIYRASATASQNTDFRLYADAASVTLP